MLGNPSSPATSSASQPASGRALWIAMIVVAVALFLLTRWYILFELDPKISDIGGPYFRYAGRACDLHHVPYQEDFKIEYPPLAWWTICAPRLLDTRRISDPQDPQQVAPVVEAYRQAFRGLMFLFDLASLVLLALIVHARRPNWVPWAALAYTVTTTILCHLLYDRLDTGLVLLLLAWAYCWVRALEESRRTIWWTAGAYAMVGLSISYKLIPIIMVPFLLLAEWNSPRRGVRLSSALVALAAAAGLPFVIQYAVSGPGVFALFEYHSERGIEVGSLYSTLMMIASVLGPAVFVSHSHGAFELSGALEGDMKTLSTIWLLALLLGTGIWALWRGSRYRRLEGYCAACFVMCSAVILAKVLSPQYFLWAIPMALLLAVEILPNRWGARWIFLAVLIAVAAMTTWIFPYNFYRSLSNPNGLVPSAGEDVTVLPSLPCIILGLRNLTYLGVVVWLGVMLYRREESRGVRKLEGQ